MRVKTGTVRRQGHKKVLKMTKGFRMTKNRLFRVAQEAVLHAGQYAYVGRKDKKSVNRRFWITRINGALTDSGLNYSKFIRALKDSKIELDRKVLAIIASNDSSTFNKIVEEVKK